MYVRGEGTEPDVRRGIRLLEQAASQGYCEAMRVLVAIYSGEIPVGSANRGRREHWSRLLSTHLAEHPEDRRIHER
jgi:TPR repeat protein